MQIVWSYPAARNLLKKKATGTRTATPVAKQIAKKVALTAAPEGADTGKAYHDGRHEPGLHAATHENHRTYQKQTTFS
jgi:hypothetical protein